MPDRILVVDDEPDIVNLAKTILEAEGYEVATASDGEEALHKASTLRPDLILLDLVMPKVTGLEVCRMLKEQEATRFVPIVMFTVLDRDVNRRMSREAGADGHLTKPFTPEGMAAEVERHLEEARQNKFSQPLGIDHARLSGRKILLEFDPATPYERLVRDFAVEASAHGEAVAVFTTRPNVIHQALLGEPGVEFHYRSRETLLTPILRRHSMGPLAIIFNSLTDLALSAGFQIAYDFVKAFLERLADRRFTTLILLNPDAHNPREAQSLRSLFANQLAYGEEGVSRVRLA